MTLLKPGEICLQPNYFLPHYGLMYERSTIAKLMVVFDESFKSNNNKSVKDFLLKGPKLIRNNF